MLKSWLNIELIAIISFIILQSTMDGNNTKQLCDQYEQVIKEVNDLNSLVKVLSNEHQLQNLEQIVIPEQYLTLLANSLFAINSVAYSYSNLKSLELPSEFSKVKQYYAKAKNPLAPTTAPAGSGPSVVINKQAAKRLIQRSTTN